MYLLPGGRTENLMKQRMITVFYGIALLLLVLFFYKSMVLNAGIAAVAALGTYEIFKATGCTKDKLLPIFSIIGAAIMPFFSYHHFSGKVCMMLFAYLFIAFSILIFRHKEINLDKAGISILITIVFTSSMSCIIVIRDQFLATELPHVALFFIALVFVGAWVADAGGYIFGRLFGKHKLSPEISPKKTIEGAVGGILINILCCLLLLLIYNIYLNSKGITADYNYLSVGILGLICGGISIVGDLSMSLVKRDCGIKDYGKILPGHGGILDRFDSVIFVAPLILGWVYFLPIVS